MGKNTTTIPVAEAAAGVTTETATNGTNTFTEALDAQLQQLKKLLEIETSRADAAEERAEASEQELETLKAKTLEQESEKLLYEAADGSTYELVQTEFRYRGTLYQGEDVITNHDLLEELIEAKAFVLKKVE